MTAYRAVYGKADDAHKRSAASATLFLGVLVVSASTDGSEGPGTGAEQPSDAENTREGPGTSPAPMELCRVSYVDVEEAPGKVARKCKCKAGEKIKNYEDSTYFYADEEYENEFEITIHSKITGEEVALAPGTEEAGKELSDSPENHTTSSILSTTQASDNGTRVEYSTVTDGTPCVVSSEDSGRTVEAGVCIQGNCNTSITTFYTVYHAYQAYDPYYYHCRVNTTSINSKLNVTIGCVASCHIWRNRTWNATKLDDGRLCLLSKEERNGQYTNKTGVCRSGSCVTADWRPWTHPNGCIESTTRRNGKVLAVKCTVLCEKGTTQKLPDGTPCLLDYQRLATVPVHVSKLIVEGICKHGICIITPPTVPAMIVQVPEEGCSHFISSVSYADKVESSCTMLCPHRQYKDVKDGTYCARSTSGKWPVVTQVGQCVAGRCGDKFPDTPPKHEKVNANFTNCRTSNELTVITGQLTVVLSCKVECSNGNFENRKDGVKCLLEYRGLKAATRSNKKNGMYVVGVCENGRCTLGRNPQNITTED